MTFKTNVHTIHFRRKHESEAYKGHQVSIRLKKKGSSDRENKNNLEFRD